MESIRTPESVPACLGRAAESDREHGVTIIGETGAREYRSYTQIRKSARRAAAALQLSDLDHLDRVMLALPTGFEFLTAFFGALTAGFVPIPFRPPDPSEGANEFRRRLRRAGVSLDARALVLGVDVGFWSRPSARRSMPFSFVGDLGSLYDEVPANITVREPRNLPETAYIQLTEGTTGVPRPVELTHRNILSNVRSIGASLDVRQRDVGVSWIPLHNPLGLIGVVCFAIAFDIELVLLRPERFLSQPESWLRAISRHEGTLSTAPNFAYHYAVRRCRESNLEGLDLSSWRVALSGGEPVRGQHLDAFVQRFRDYGLRDEVCTPVYGLSEATIGVTVGPLEGSFQMDAINRRTLERQGRAEALPEEGASHPAERMHLVSVGTPLEGVDVRVVDEDGEPVDARVLGEVAIHGPNVMKGYIGEIDQRGACRLEDDWLYTGDLGYRVDDQLYIVGRACDRVELGARSVFPEEVEFFVNAVDGVHAGRTAVFGVESEVDGGGETDEATQLIVAFELQSGTARQDVEEPIERLLEAHLTLEPDELVALAPRSIPRTKSGKVRRFLARKLYVEGRLDRRDREAGVPDLDRIVRAARHGADTVRSVVEKTVGRWLS